MEKKMLPKYPTLAELDDIETLKERYQIFDSRVLLKWMKAVTGSHREAMAAVLRERGHTI